MTKKQIVKDFLLKNVDIRALKRDYKNSWLIDKPFEWLYYNGIVYKHFSYSLKKEAIELAGYKHPKSDRTWSTVEDVQREILNEYRYFLVS